MSRLNEGAGQVAEEVPDDVAGGDEMVAEKEHAEEDDTKDNGKEGPGGNIGLTIRGRFGAHLGEELAHGAPRRNPGASEHSW